MALNNPYDAELTRLRVLLGVMLTAFMVLGVALWRAQVLHGSRHSARLDRQSIRRVRLPGLRGTLVDRSGVILAENRPSYCVAMYIEELRRPGRLMHTLDRVDEVIQRLAGIMRIAPAVTRDDIRLHVRRRLPLPFLAWEDLDMRALGRWAESGEVFPGVEILVRPMRHYGRGELAAHMLGYTGQADPPDTGTPYDFYQSALTGRYGIERSLDERLAGTAGWKLIRVDATGFNHAEYFEREPIDGESVRLTLDAELQAAAEDELRGSTGAVVVVDVRNGDILALASAPAFDPNLVPDARAFAAFNRDPAKPLFNRAVAGAYPPGSIFKPLVAIAALENGGASAETEYTCPGYFELGGVRFHCWRRSGHGSIALRKAIEQSCNVYFFHMALKAQYERIFHMADALGFGHRTGIALDFESPGLLPGNRWKEQHRGDSWRAGDTCNVSIGQGALLVTPLQMAMFAAALANGGFIYKPRLVVEAWEEGNLIQKMAWSDATLAVVRGGMLDAVEAERGTARRARLHGVRVAGKTGTAEYGPRAARRKHAWTIAFAPADAPRFAVALVLENMTSGGTDAAPRVGRILARLLHTTTVFAEQAEAEETP